MTYGFPETDLTMDDGRLLGDLIGFGEFYSRKLKSTEPVSAVNWAPYGTIGFFKKAELSLMKTKIMVQEGVIGLILTASK